MQYTSAEYREGMKQLARKKSYMKINIGLINQSAQENSVVQSEGFTYFSDLIKPLDNESVSKRYATFERGYTQADGTKYFLPREGSGVSFYNAGMVTEELCKDGKQPSVLIKFTTEDPVDIKGLTIQFGEIYPVRFMVETDEKTVIIENDSPLCRTEETYNNVTFMKITAMEMLKRNTRLRIEMLTFGIGIVMDNEKIVSANLKSIVSPISDSLPAIDFDVTIENMDKYYNVDNADSAIQYMSTGQELEVYYGYALDSGTVEYVKGGTLYMKDWSADDTQAKFQAVDIFEYMQDEYKKGEYRPEGISLFELATDVLKDSGIDPDKYWVDPHLKNSIVYNPLPALMHKECLQLIANAGRCVLMQNRDGVIMLKTSYVPEVSVNANQAAPYGDIQQILKEGEYNEYASFERGYTQADGKQYFLPREQNYMEAGYVSSSISDANGLFDENPIITFSLESAYTFYNMNLIFGTVWPEEFLIRTYNNNQKISTYRSKAVKQNTLVSYTFVDVDKVEIEFTRAAPYNRIHLQRVKFGDVTDYEITYDDLKKTPSGTKLEKVKEVRVVRTIYTKGTELKDITTEEITLSTIPASYEFNFNNAVHDLSVCCLIGGEEFECGAVIEQTGTYYCKVSIQEPPATPTDVKLTIRGYEYGISTTMVSTKLNNSGNIKTWDNPLISSEEDAANLVEWVGGYYASENEYKLSYRGDPVLDPNDLAYLESRVVDNFMIRLEEVELKFSGGLSGMIKARREKYVAATKDGLAGSR